MNGPSPRIVIAAIIAAAAAAFALRPVRQPERTGTWEPAERHRTRR